MGHAGHALDLILRPWQGECVGAHSRVVRWERQDQVWILERPLWLRGREGISGPSSGLGRVQEGQLEVSRPEVLSA